jgi:hypothetical protein
MSAADFIKKRFLGKELCIFFGNDVETLALEQSWMYNKEFFRGVIEEVEDDIIVLSIQNNGHLYIHADTIISFWEPDFDYHKAVSASLTRHMYGAKDKYK